MENNNCKISVIVPVYNVEKYLSRCLDSLLNQTLTEIEIICVNDGSKDKSLEILNDYAKKDNRVKIINQENSGVAMARNNALKVAVGEFVGFVDSDDWVSPDFYENLYNSAIENNAEIACSNIVKSFVSGETEDFLKYEKTEVFETVSDKLEVAQIPKYNYTVNRIYKREALLKNDIEFPKSNLFEDAPFSLEAITLLGKMVTVPNGTYFYFTNENSLTKSSKSLKKDFAISCKYVRKIIEKHNLSWKYLDQYPYFEKCIVKILGIPLFVVKMNFVLDKVFLFGFIKIAEIKHIKRY